MITYLLVSIFFGGACFGLGWLAREMRGDSAIDDETRVHYQYHDMHDEITAINQQLSTYSLEDLIAEMDYVNESWRKRMLGGES